MSKTNNVKYTAKTFCSANKYNKDHILISEIKTDDDLEKRIKELMSCEHIEHELEMA